MELFFLALIIFSFVYPVVWAISFLVFVLIFTADYVSTAKYMHSQEKKDECRNTYYGRIGLTVLTMAVIGIICLTVNKNMLDDSNKSHPSYNSYSSSGSYGSSSKYSSSSSGSSSSSSHSSSSSSSHWYPSNDPDDYDSPDDYADDAWGDDFDDWDDAYDYWENY